MAPAKRKRNTTAISKKANGKVETRPGTAPDCSNTSSTVKRQKELSEVEDRQPQTENMSVGADVPNRCSSTLQAFVNHARQHALDNIPLDVLIEVRSETFS